MWAQFPRPFSARALDKMAAGSGPGTRLISQASIRSSSHFEGSGLGRESRKMSQEWGGGSCAAEDQNFNMMTHLAQYGLLCFIWLLLTVVWLIVYRKFGAPVPPAAGTGEGRSSSINDGSSIASHDQTLSEGTAPLE